MPLPKMGDCNWEYGALIRYLKYLFNGQLMDSVAERAHGAVERVEEGAAERAVDDALIERVVRAFYAKVREDPLLAPVFAARIEDWEPHLARMFAFWSSVMVTPGRYRGNPMAKHAPLPVDAAHFDRWLALFADTAAELCTAPVAARFVERSRRIAQSLELGIAAHHGVLLGRNQRFRRSAD
jgi:hemoglobin